jgi:uncharacterized membrane protein
MNREDLYKENVQQLSGRLHRIHPILDAAGKVVQYAISFLRVELRHRDHMQIIVGSSVLAVPIGSTQETRDFGQNLSLVNVVALAFLSIIFYLFLCVFQFLS